MAGLQSAEGEWLPPALRPVLNTWVEHFALLMVDSFIFGKLGNSHLAMLLKISLPGCNSFFHVAIKIIPLDSVPVKDK